MGAAALYTYKDLVDHCLDWLGANPSAEARRDARRAILEAMRTIGAASPWSYYLTAGRMATVAPYATGTISYDNTGGTYERMVTLTSGTWPDWAAFGWITINNVPYEVSARKSNTQITLTSSSNPGADVPAGTSYTLYRDSYPIPVDCRSIGAVVLPGYAVDLVMDHPNDWMERRKLYRGAATPRSYSIFGDANYLNTLQVTFFPPPDAIYPVDLLYLRRPRALSLEEYSAGKVTTTADSATVTGSGTEWASRHVGSVFRVSRTREAPTAPWGANPTVCDRVVTAVNSSTSITLDDVVPESLSSVPHVLSDPVDVEDGAMLTALLRCCEMYLGVARAKANGPWLQQAYERELIRAREADSRSFREETVGGRRPWPYRLAYMPIGPDVG